MIMAVIKKKKKPKFNVPNLGFFKSVKKRWRRPRGTHNKKRMKFQFMGALPKIGYRNAADTRGLHPCGSFEVLVHNEQELEGLTGVVIRIASGVGGRKKVAIVAKAKSINLPIVNLSDKAQAKKAQIKVAVGKAKLEKADAKKAAKAGVKQ